jgi:hypothetical protein
MRDAGIDQRMDVTPREREGQAGLLADWSEGGRIHPRRHAIGSEAEDWLAPQGNHPQTGRTSHQEQSV